MTILYFLLLPVGALLFYFGFIVGKRERTAYLDQTFRSYDAQLLELQKHIDEVVAATNANFEKITNTPPEDYIDVIELGK